MQEHHLDLVLKLATDSVEAPRWTRDDYEKALSSTPAVLLIAGSWVAEFGGELVGFAVARWLRGEPAAEIESVVVDHAYRRQGIGAALIRECMEWARTEGATAVRLEVRASNTAALALYRKLGFVSQGVRPAYYSSPTEDAILLQTKP